MPSIMEVIRARKSVRRMKPDPLPEAALAAILEAARWAPSWANRQCWRFVVVRDPAKRKLLAAIGGPPQAMENAPVIIVACAHPAQSGQRDGLDYFMLDMGIACEHLILEAAAWGVGSCWAGVFDSAKVRAVLDIPEEVAVVALIPLGYTSYEPRPRPRLELAEIAFTDAWPVGTPAGAIPPAPAPYAPTQR